MLESGVGYFTSNFATLDQARTVSLDGSITKMWSLNVFISDFTYLAGE